MSCQKYEIQNTFQILVAFLRFQQVIPIRLARNDGVKARIKAITGSLKM